MPFRNVISRGVSTAQAFQLLDALADLLVNLHLAAEPAPPEPSAEVLVGLLAQELEAFVEGNTPDLGAAPLDPSLFGGGRRQ
jgi:hypothetical protein